MLGSICEQLETHLAEKQVSSPLVVGIHTGGAWVAHRLHQFLSSKELCEEPLASLDISFYRDDFSRIGLNPKVTLPDWPTTTEEKHVILVDDVLMTGRTIRAALNVLFEIGRPASVTLVTLLDLNARELPIRADITGMTLELPANQRVKLVGPENLSFVIDTIPDSL